MVRRLKASKQQVDNKVKLEIAVADELSERVIETIQNIAQTGKIGDGKIFVFELNEAIRVRTGEKGEDAL